MIIAQITIACDRCDEQYDNADVTAKLIRQAAAEDGWVVARPGGKDFCPECRARDLRPAAERRVVPTLAPPIIRYEDWRDEMRTHLPNASDEQIRELWDEAQGAGRRARNA